MTTMLPIPDIDPYVSYSVVASTTGPFAVPFPITSVADLTVAVGGAVIDGSLFSFTPNATDYGGYPSGTVTLATAVSSTTVEIWRDIPLSRLSSYLNGPLDIDALNLDLARLTAQVQDARVVARRQGSLRVLNLGADAGSPVSTAVAAALSQTTSIQALGVFAAGARIFLPENYGAVGDGVTDDRAALQLAVTACQNAGGGIVLLTKLYAVSSKVIVNASNVHVTGCGLHTGLTGLTASAIQLLSFESAAVTTSTTYTTNNVSKGGKTIRFTSVTGFSPGDVIMIRVTKASGYYTSAIYCLVATIKSIAGNDVTINTGVPLPLTPGTDTVKDIWKQPMLDNCSAENFSLRKGANSHADTKGMQFFGVRNGALNRLRFQDMTGHGVYMSGGLDNHIGQLWFDNCASIGYAAIEMESQTGLMVEALHGTELQGFGARVYRSSYCTLQSVVMEGVGYTTNGRGYKLAQSLAIQTDQVIASGSASATGTGVTEGSCDNVFGSIIANDNVNEALWFSDQSNNNNLIKSVQAYGNGGGAAPAISVYPSDNDNVILNIDTDATVGGSAANSLYFAGARCIATRKGGVMTRMDRNATNTAALASGGFNKVAMTRAVEDRGNGYDSGNGRFKCVFPGDYQVRMSALPTSMSTVTALSMALYKNGAAQPYRAECAQFSGSLQLNAQLRLDQGDYVELYIYYTSGAGNLVIDGNVDWTNVTVKQLAA